MYKCSHFVMIMISGLVWAVIGIMLMTVGMHHLMDAFRLFDDITRSASPSLIKGFAAVLKSPEPVMMAIIGCCLLVGYAKGHYVLTRSVKSGVQRILSHPNPSEIKKIYGKKYYFLILGMMGLGLLLKALKLPLDLHGAIDLAIGSALLKGALVYFKYAIAEKRGKLAQEKL